MAERVLTLRELNRATLTRQLLLERKRLSPAAVIERLVGMQAQWPRAPYVGIWTRTTSFRREALERELARGTVLKATMMRQTLHLVTRRDYGLILAAMNGTNFPWETAQAKLLAQSMRALAEAGPVATPDALAHLEREHGLTGIDGAARLARSTLARTRPAPPRDGARHGRPEGRFVAIEEPDAHDPLEARAEILRRYLAAFGPASRRDMVKWTMMHVPETGGRSMSSNRCVVFATSTAGSSSTPRARSSRIPTPRRRFVSCRSGTTCSSPSPIGRECFQSPTERWSSARTATSLRPSLSTDSSRVSGGREGRVAFEPFAPAAAPRPKEVEDEAERLEAFLAD